MMPMEPRPEGTYHDGHQDGLIPLEPLDLSACGSVDALVRAMGSTAFGGRKTGEAADALETMVRDPSCGVVMTLSGAMTIAKMGLIVVEMIERGMVQAIVSTGALMAHGLIEGTGRTHFKHDPRRTDEQNFVEGYNRVYDTLELEKNFDDLETTMNQVLDTLPDDLVLCSSRFHTRFGRYLNEHQPGSRGILQSAVRHRVPVFVPAFTDSELGLNLALYNRERVKAGKPRIRFDPFLDLEHFTALACAYEKLGIFTIGGGVPRNWAQQLGPYVELMVHRKLIDKPQIRRYQYAVRICPEPIHWGGLSGCTYQEGVSWGKFASPQQGGLLVEVPADATIAWPLIARAVTERLDAEPAPPKHEIQRPDKEQLWLG